eukprot:3389617-Rhodomonas_salina.1
MVALHFHCGIKCKTPASLVQTAPGFRRNDSIPLVSTGHGVADTLAVQTVPDIHGVRYRLRQYRTCVADAGRVSDECTLLACVSTGHGVADSGRLYGECTPLLLGGTESFRRKPTGTTRYLSTGHRVARAQAHSTIRTGHRVAGAKGDRGAHPPLLAHHPLSDCLYSIRHLSTARAVSIRYLLTASPAAAAAAAAAARSTGRLPAAELAAAAGVPTPAVAAAVAAGWRWAVVVVVVVGLATVETAAAAAVMRAAVLLLPAPLLVAAVAAPESGAEHSPSLPHLACKTHNLFTRLGPRADSDADSDSQTGHRLPDAAAVGSPPPPLPHPLLRLLLPAAVAAAAAAAARGRVAASV